MTGPDSREPSLTRRAFVQATVCTGAASLVAAAGKQPAAPAFLAGSDWPMYRHDPALSAASPLRGGLAEAPRVAWSLDLGGPHVPAESVVVRDVTGDGRDDFLTVAADSVTCRDCRGKLRWKLDNFLNAAILDVLDFAGDGSRGILLTTTRAGKVDTYLVSGKTGKAVHLWLDENNFGGHVRIGKLLPGVAGVQIAATSSGQTPPKPHGGDVRLVSFERGLERPNFRVRQHVTGVFYSPLILIADLDGDGRGELVVLSHEQIWAFDTKTGRQTFHAAYAPSIRTYMATVAVVKLRPSDVCPALVMINPSLPGLKAVSQDGKTFACELWKVVVEPGPSRRFADRPWPSVAEVRPAPRRVWREASPPSRGCRPGHLARRRDRRGRVQLPAVPLSAPASEGAWPARSSGRAALATAAPRRRPTWPAKAPILLGFSGSRGMVLEETVGESEA